MVPHRRPHQPLTCAADGDGWRVSGREGKARPRVPMGPSISRYSPRRPKSNIGNEALLRSRSFPTYSSLPAAPSASDTRRLTGSMQRIGTKRPVSTGLAIRVLCSPVPRATGSIFGTNVGMAQRAGEFTAADLAKRLQLCRRLVCVGRSRPIAAMLGASFGSEPETPTLHGTRARREAPGRSDRPSRIWGRGLENAGDRGRPSWTNLLFCWTALGPCEFFEFFLSL